MVVKRLAFNNDKTKTNGKTCFSKLSSGECKAAWTCVNDNNMYGSTAIVNSCYKQRLLTATIWFYCADTVCKTNVYVKNKRIDITIITC